MEIRLLMRCLVTILLALSWMSQDLTAQQADQDRLKHVFDLEKQGQFALAAEAAEPLAQSASLGILERSQAAMILGIAQHQQGKFQQAADAYDLSLRLLGKNLENSAQYSATLSAYATLYRDMGRLDESEQLQMKALHSYERNSDHAGIAMACKSLAGLALARKRIAEGRAYLGRAVREAGLTSILNEDFLASLTARQGQLAELEKNPAAAVASYRRSLALWRHAHGEQHVLVGWGLILLGKATAETGNTTESLQDLREGLAILNKTMGPLNVHTLSAKMVYANVLDAAGSHSEAAEIRTSAKGLLHSFYQSQCIECRVSVLALSSK